MPRELFNIPLSRWVHGTIEKMNNSGKSDIQSWSEYWFETYKELGGLSINSGTKGCPLHGAYGLWRLGRIKDGNIPYQQQTIHFINQEFGRNAAYAAIAIGLLEERKAARSEIDLWIQVRELYKSKIHEEPAISEQGEVRVAKILFEEGHIVTDI
jgi:hypothetical protein